MCVDLSEAVVYICFADFEMNNDLIDVPPLISLDKDAEGCPTYIPGE